MDKRLGVEEIEPEHWVAWVFALPGCFSAGPTRRAAEAGVPAAVAAHAAWLAGHGETSPPAGSDASIGAGEIEAFTAFISQGDYLVNAFFADDRRPLTGEDVARALRLLAYSRADLLALLAPRGQGAATQVGKAGGNASIAGLLGHIAQAENWYLGRFGLDLPPAALGEESLARLAAVRARLRAALPALAGDDRAIERLGEWWSGRKLVRRALWHERDHTQQIATLLGRD